METQALTYVRTCTHINIAGIHIWLLAVLVSCKSLQDNPVMIICGENQRSKCSVHHPLLVSAMQWAEGQQNSQTAVSLKRFFLLFGEDLATVMRCSLPLSSACKSVSVYKSKLQTLSFTTREYRVQDNLRAHTIAFSHHILLLVYVSIHP